jgi:hypothetical protein
MDKPSYDPHQEVSASRLGAPPMVVAPIDVTTPVVVFTVAK